MYRAAQSGLHQGTDMTQAKLTTNAVELMHSALDAIDQGRGALAITFLKQLLMLKPGSAEAHYLLGTQQAKVGMLGRAVASLRTALAFQPELDAARLRLGMLLASSGQLSEARAVWAPLNKLRSDDPFYLFKTGLLLIAEGDHEEGIACLRRGISLNHINGSLNDDMNCVADEVRRQKYDALGARDAGVAASFA
jgi:tetratricopeptide (TPR) repeat protein